MSPVDLAIAIALLTFAITLPLGVHLGRKIRR